VLKKRDDPEPLLVVIFTLMPKEQVSEGNEAQREKEEKKDENDDDELD
jgi:hypothetical protein